jgi:hypothetical protein
VLDPPIVLERVQQGGGEVAPSASRCSWDTAANSPWSDRSSSTLEFAEITSRRRRARVIDRARVAMASE